MARIAGVSLPNNKRIEIALTYIYGIGLNRSQIILQAINLDPNTRAKDVTEDQVNEIRKQIEKLEFNIEGELRREVLSNIKRLKEISSYRGSRHTHGLPGRGQKSKTNGRTVRGNVRKTVGSGRKVALQKT